MPHYLPLVLPWYRHLCLCILSLSLHVPEYLALINHTAAKDSQQFIRSEMQSSTCKFRAKLFEVLYFKGAFSNFPNSSRVRVLGESWSQYLVNLRTAKKATLEVHFPGKKHHTDNVLLQWNQLYWQSCSLCCFSNTSPWSAHTWNELSNQKQVLPV